MSAYRINQHSKVNSLEQQQQQQLHGTNEQKIATAVGKYKY